MSRRDPLRELEELLDRVDRDVDRIGRELGQLPGPIGDLASGSAVDELVPGTDRSPAVDVEDRVDEFVVTIDLPGYDRENIDVSANERTLRVSADREVTSEAGEEGSYVRRERRRSVVNRSISLPEATEEESASATHTNGVLTVRLPKEAVGSGRDIEIAAETAPDDTESAPTEREHDAAADGTESETGAEDESAHEAALDVKTVDGLGTTYAERLREDGIESVDDLAAADAERVAESAEVSGKRARDWIDQARN
jgi:HSP20 family protein